MDIKQWLRDGENDDIFFGFNTPFAKMLTFPQSSVNIRQIILVSLNGILFSTMALVAINTKIK